MTRVFILNNNCSLDNKTLLLHFYNFRWWGGRGGGGRRWGGGGRISWQLLNIIMNIREQFLGVCFGPDSTSITTFSIVWTLFLNHVVLTSKWHSPSRPQKPNIQILGSLSICFKKVSHQKLPNLWIFPKISIGQEWLYKCQ